VVGMFTARPRPLIDHIVLFRFRPDLPPAALGDLFQDLRGLASEVKGITGIRCGAYSSPEGLNQGFSHAMVMTFSDAAARDAYLPHPAHQRVVERLVPMLEGGLQGVVAFDFSDGCF
jgi:hypothetical protein